MSTHNIFSWKNKKNINTFGLKEAFYQECCIYSQTCVKQAPKGKPKTGFLRQVLA